jgi:hypothetical protein
VLCAVWNAQPGYHGHGDDLLSLFERLKETLTKWELHREKLIEAIEYTNGTHKEDDVLVAILSGALTLWADENGAVVTEIMNYPQIKVLNMFIVAGNLGLLESMEPRLIEYAKQNGCKRITGGGRKGWTRSLPGYSEAGYFMYKDLTP